MELMLVLKAVLEIAEDNNSIYDALSSSVCIIDDDRHVEGVR